MVSYRIFAFAGLAAALPLNINLGAYSPALVVGDGEISFGGATAAAAAAPAAAAPVAAAPAASVAASAPATAAAASVDPTLSQQGQQIAALQGMGKEIAPRVKAVNAPSLGKRDLTGFDRALKFAEAALVKGPKVQLGTGEGGSGVGIIVDNNPTAAARTGAAKRDVTESSAPVRRTKVTTMYVRRGVPASLQSSTDITARDVAPAPGLSAFSEAPVSRRDAIDAVNLNVDGDTGVTMTFVETVEDEE